MTRPPRFWTNGKEMVCKSIKTSPCKNLACLPCCSRCFSIQALRPSGPPRVPPEPSLQGLVWDLHGGLIWDASGVWLLPGPWGRGRLGDLRGLGPGGTRGS